MTAPIVGVVDCDRCEVRATCDPSACIHVNPEDCADYEAEYGPTRLTSLDCPYPGIQG